MTAAILAIQDKRHSKTPPAQKLSLLSPEAARLNAVSKKHAQTLIAASEDVRRHIARELHDDIGQRLSLLSIKLGLLQQLHSMDDPRGDLADSIRDLDILISDVHSLSHSLHSSRIEQMGLSSALREIFNRLLESYGTHVDFFESNIRDRLPPGFALCFFRVAQESLNNAIKHGGASRVRVDLIARRGMLTMRVQDFGAGFDKSLMPEGIGLVTMEERMAAIEGTLTIESEPGSGTVVTASADLLL